MQQELADSSNHSIYFIFKKSECKLCHKTGLKFTLEEVTKLSN